MVPPLFAGSEKRAYYCFLDLSVIKMMAWEERGYYTEMFKIRFNHGCMLVIGGAKSGKSRFALNVCNSMNRKRIFLATAQALDREMEERIRRHREGRGEGWHTPLLQDIQNRLLLQTCLVDVDDVLGGERGDGRSGADILRANRDSQEQDDRHSRGCDLGHAVPLVGRTDPLRPSRWIGMSRPRD